MGGCAPCCRRFYLEIVGRQRVRLLEVWEQDGYRIARPQVLHDDPPALGDARQLVRSSLNQQRIWLKRMSP